MRTRVKYKAVSIGLLMLALSGCGSSSIPANYSFQEGQNQGVVFFSASGDAVQGSQAIFYLDGGPVNGGSMVYSRKEAFDGFAPSEFDDSNGQLIVLTLPAGKHKVTGWQVKNNNARFSAKEAPAPLEFEVTAGRAKYLGNLHANMQAGKNLIGQAVVADTYPEVRDRRDRDVDLFGKRYPQLKDKVVVETLAIGPWVAAKK